MKFKKFVIKEYQQFKNQEIIFNNNLTLIYGGAGTGKSTLYSLLKSKLVDSDYIEVEGDQVNKKFIFFDGYPFSDKHACSISERLQNKIYNFIAYRRAYNIEAPIVMDCPFIHLCPEEIISVFNSLVGLKQQLIIFLSKYELDSIKQTATYELKQKDGSTSIKRIDTKEGKG